MTATAKIPSDVWGAVAGAKNLTLNAWAFWPDHSHLLVRTGTTPLGAGRARPPDRLPGGRPVARAGLVGDVGPYPAPRLVALRGVRPPSIQKPTQRGRADRTRWDRVLPAGK